MEGEHRAERGSPGPPFTRDGGQLPATCLVVRMRHWELRVTPLPFPVAGNRTVTLPPPPQPFSTQPPRALLPWLLGSSALLCSDTAFPAPQRPPSGMASQAPAAWEPDPGGGGGGGSSERLCLALAGHLTAPFVLAGNLSQSSAADLSQR